MANYLSYQFANVKLSERFSFKDEEPVRGLRLWQSFIGLVEPVLPENVEDLNMAALLNLLTEHKDILPEDRTQPILQEDIPNKEKALEILLLGFSTFGFPSKRSCPRLFVSHRQQDWPYALRIAQLARSKKFEYWVDVLSPSLKALSNNQSNLAPRMVSLLTACILEMALINCTHVIACMTTNSRGTLWQPYEYGRIVRIPLTFRRACAWVHPRLQATDFPEYMLLGVITKNESEILVWMDKEIRKPAWKQCTDQGEDRGDVILDLDQLPESQKIQKFPIRLKIQLSEGPIKILELTNKSERKDCLDGLIDYLAEALPFDEIKKLVNLTSVSSLTKITSPVTLRLTTPPLRSAVS